MRTQLLTLPTLVLHTVEVHEYPRSLDAYC